MLPPVTRPEPPTTGDERAMLTVWLDYQRTTLLWKCELIDGAALVGGKAVPVDLAALWKELGVERQGDTAVFDDQAPLAGVRKAILS